MRKLCALLIAALPLTACAGDDVAAGFTAEVVDSAGVQLVRNGDGAVPDSVLTPDLVFGTVDGPEELQFHLVRAMTITPQRTILVADNSGTIREFDDSGAHLATFGGQGDGPGEFRAPVRIFAHGDTIAVFDGRNYRLTGLVRSGGVAYTTLLRQETSIATPSARLGNGWLVEPRTVGWKLEVGKPYRDTIRVARADADSAAPGGGLAVATAREILAYARGRTYGIASELGGMTANSPLFEPQPSHAVDGSGNIYIAAGSPYRIDVHAADGTLRRRITRAHTPVPVTDELLERYWSKVNTYLDTTTVKHSEWSVTVDAERGRADLPVNEVLPATGRLLVSDDGVLWVQRPDLVADPLTLVWTRERSQDDHYWDVFDTDGTFIRTVRLPAAFRPIAVASRSIYGTLRDELDVEHVARFTIGEGT